MSLSEEIRLREANQGALKVLLALLVTSSVVSTVVVSQITLYFEIYRGKAGSLDPIFIRGFVSVAALQVLCGPLWYLYTARHRVETGRVELNEDTMNLAILGLFAAFSACPAGLFQHFNMWERNVPWDIETLLFCGACWASSSLVAFEYLRVRDELEEYEQRS